MQKNGECDNITLLPEASSSPSLSTSPTIFSSPGMIKHKNKAKLMIKCFKWRHSFKKPKYEEFFDYESKDFNLYEFNTFSSQGTLKDNFTHIKFEPEEINEINDSEKFNQEREFLKQNITFSINDDNNFIIHTNKHCYISAKYLPSTSELLQIKKGTEIKIGKYTLNILMVKKNNEITIETNKYSSMQNQEEKICKICLRNNTDLPFISVCNCKGTLQYAHGYCLFTWIKNKCKINFEYVNPAYYSLTLCNFYCEICKSPFPFGVYTDKEHKDFFYLVDGLEKFQNFIILDLKYHDKVTQQNKERCKYILLNLSNYYKNEITIGRGKNCIFHLNNISVSREHCVISYEKDNNIIKIVDNKSKFGTLIQNIDSCTDIILSNSNPNITIQKGNTVYNFSYCLV